MFRPTSLAANVESEAWYWCPACLRRAPVEQDFPIVRDLKSDLSKTVTYVESIERLLINTSQGFETTLTEMFDEIRSIRNDAVFSGQQEFASQRSVNAEDFKLEFDRFANEVRQQKLVANPTVDLSEVLDAITKVRQNITEKIETMTVAVPENKPLCEDAQTQTKGAAKKATTDISRVAGIARSMTTMVKIDDRAEEQPDGEEEEEAPMRATKTMPSKGKEGESPKRKKKAADLSRVAGLARTMTSIGIAKIDDHTEEKPDEEEEAPMRATKTMPSKKANTGEEVAKRALNRSKTMSKTEAEVSEAASEVRPKTKKVTLTLKQAVPEASAQKAVPEASAQTPSEPLGTWNKPLGPTADAGHTLSWDESRWHWTLASPDRFNFAKRRYSKNIESPEATQDVLKYGTSVEDMKADGAQFEDKEFVEQFFGDIMREFNHAREMLEQKAGTASTQSPVELHFTLVMPQPSPRDEDHARWLQQLKESRLSLIHTSLVEKGVPSDSLQVVFEAGFETNVIIEMPLFSA